MAYVVPKKDENLGYMQRGMNESGSAVQKNAGITTSGTGASAQGAAPAGDTGFTQSKSQGGAAAAIFDRNKSTNQGVYNTLLQPGQRAAQGAQKALGDEQADYTQRAGTAYKAPTFDAADVDKVGRDAGATSRVASVVNYKAPDFEDYKTNVNTSVAQPQQLSTGNFQSQLMKNKAGSNYTKGMAALDSALFGKSKGMGQLQQEYGTLQQGVNDTVAAGGQIEGRIAGEQAPLVSQMQQQAKTALGGRMQSIKDAAAGSAKSKQDELNLSNKNASSGFIKPVMGPDGVVRNQGLSQQLYTDFGGKLNNSIFGSKLSPAEKSRLQQKYMEELTDINEESFIRNPEAKVSGENMYSEQDATDLNELSKLLGLGDTYSAGSFDPQAASFDQDGVNKEAQSVADKFNKWLQEEEMIRSGKAPARTDRIDLLPKPQLAPREEDFHRVVTDPEEQAAIRAKSERLMKESGLDYSRDYGASAAAQNAVSGIARSTRQIANKLKKPS